jgi:hypothetical protein
MLLFCLCEPIIPKGLMYRPYLRFLETALRSLEQYLEKQLQAYAIKLLCAFTL